MEYALRNGLDPRSWKTVVLAGLLGSAAGFAMFLPGLLRSDVNRVNGAVSGLIVNTVLGFLVGMVMALINRKFTAYSHPTQTDGF